MPSDLIDQELRDMAARWENNPVPRCEPHELHAQHSPAKDAYFLCKFATTVIRDHDVDSKPPTREMFELLGARRRGNTLFLKTIAWSLFLPYPTFAVSGHACFLLDTVAKLRAACLLLGVPCNV